MTRGTFWTQLLIGWLPVGVLFAVMISTAHGGTVWQAAPIALRMVLAGAVLAPLVRRFALLHPWPHPMRLTFVGLHLGAALLYGAAWFMITLAVETVFNQVAVMIMGTILVPFLLLGTWQRRQRDYRLSRFYGNKSHTNATSAAGSPLVHGRA